MKEVFYFDRMNLKAFLLFLLCSCSFLAKASIPVDSIGLEISNGKDTIILHEVGKGENFYSIAKRYKVNFQTLMSFNNAEVSSLKIGQLLRVPKTPISVPIAAATLAKPLNGGLTSNVPPDTIPGRKYTVKKGDYLYSIAREHNTTIQNIKAANDLRSNSLKIGQVIVIPDQKIMALATDTNKQAEEKDKTDSENKVLSPTRYMKNIKEVHETGVASWMKTDVAGTGGKSFALHRSAPNGTIIKVTNTMNNKSVLVKVIGPLPDTGENDNIIIKLSNMAAKMLGATNDRFQAKLHYAIPKEKE